MTDEANAERILKTLTAPGGTGSVSELELSQLHNISLVLAKQQLLVAEQLQVLCRDESADGLRFFPNRFNEFASNSAAATAAAT
jgi:hypothetical protein